VLRGFATINWTDDLEAAKRWYSELLGVEPYFERAGPDGRLAYAEFRLGDSKDELGSSTARGRLPARRQSRAAPSCTGTSTTSR
jgi:catechol 2,3-dioxygenase-like lactoylglutathione lyase family enzyme